MAFESLFAKYDRLVLFDTETTGLQFSRDEIIEFAAVVVELVDGVPTITREYDELVALTPVALCLRKSQSSPASPPRICGKRVCPKPGSAGTLRKCSPETACFWPTMPISI